MTQKELYKIIEQHKHWWNEDCEGWEGMKANLRDAMAAAEALSDTLFPQMQVDQETLRLAKEA